MTEKHYIVRRTLVAGSGEALEEKTFSPDDEAAISFFELPSGKTALYATSFCNKHDMRLAEISS